MIEIELKFQSVVFEMLVQPDHSPDETYENGADTSSEKNNISPSRSVDMPEDVSPLQVIDDPVTVQPLLGPLSKSPTVQMKRTRKRVKTEGEWVKNKTKMGVNPDTVYVDRIKSKKHGKKRQIKARNYNSTCPYSCHSISQEE